MEFFIVYTFALGVIVSLAYQVSINLKQEKINEAHHAVWLAISHNCDILKSELESLRAEVAEGKTKT